MFCREPCKASTLGRPVQRRRVLKPFCGVRFGAEFSQGMFRFAGMAPERLQSTLAFSAAMLLALEAALQSKAQHSVLSTHSRPETARQGGSKRHPSVLP